MQDLEFFNAVLKQAATLKAGSCRYPQISARHSQIRPSSFVLGIPNLLGLGSAGGKVVFGNLGSR